MKIQKKDRDSQFSQSCYNISSSATKRLFKSMRISTFNLEISEVFD
ncbi:unnamed protein product [Blumeria hordei]|uniref:Uncharacterized protein n=1 Tax=Blumeria hordei TaxID=2867405 RepID=A0A383ULX7_BLUHO|nr:unnamed protein product [Blumeria hordei]